MTSLILGIWFFSSLVYRDQNLPRPNPDLIMSIHFVDTKTNTLKYYRKNENGFCERQADYRIEDGLLYQTVVWVHPENADFCAQDPDMVLGTETRTPVEVNETSLKMQLPLGEEVITYVWTRTRLM